MEEGKKLMEEGNNVFLGSLSDRKSLLGETVEFVAAVLALGCAVADVIERDAGDTPAGADELGAFAGLALSAVPPIRRQHQIPRTSALRLLTNVHVRLHAAGRHHRSGMDR